MKKPTGIHIIHEDKDILVVDKPAGLLTMGTDKEKERTLYFRLTDYVRKGNAKSRERIFIVHRLDREASGVVLLARHFAAKQFLQDNWHGFEKKYLALVHALPRQEEGTIKSLLAENEAFRVYTTRDRTVGKPATTHYRVLSTTRDSALLEVILETGRKHQIRVHLASIGHPILGDKKYGQKDAAPRLALHAHKLRIQHPRTKQWLEFTAKPPAILRPPRG